MCVCVCIYMCMYVHIYVYVCMWVWVCMYIYICVCVYTYMYVYIHIYISSSYTNFIHDGVFYHLILRVCVYRYSCVRKCYCACYFILCIELQICFYCTFVLLSQQWLNKDAQSINQLIQSILRKKPFCVNTMKFVFSMFRESLFTLYHV